MKILGLDVGSRRIGVAVSDALGITAQPAGVVRRGEGDEAIDEIGRIASEKGVTEIIVGLPLNMNATRGERARDAAAFAGRLEERLGLPVKLWDERLSTAQAERLMISADTSRGKRKRKIDKLAAQIVLQSYLDCRGLPR